MNDRTWAIDLFAPHKDRLAQLLGDDWAFHSDFAKMVKMVADNNASPAEAITLVMAERELSAAK